MSSTPLARAGASSADYVARYGHGGPPLAVAPLTDPIACSKAGALYGMHAYWSKKPHDAVGTFIRHYTRPGDLVLDPFCGSGGTLLAALREGRPAMGFDRSPAAVFIASHYSRPADPARVRPALAQVLDAARASTERTLTAASPAETFAGGKGLYGTWCDRCNGPAELRSTLFDHGQPRGIPQPVDLAYSCPVCGAGTRIATDRDRQDLERVASSPLSRFVPADKMMHRDGIWGDCWRKGTSSFATVAELFTARNARALAALREAIANVDDAHARDVLTFAFSGHLFCATAMQQVRAGGGGFAKGTYYVPGRFLERNVFTGFARRVKAVLAGKEQILPVSLGPGPGLHPEPLIEMGDARSLPLPEGCVDYVFTDPPYEGAVQYAELNFLWETWLGLDTSWHADEIIVNRSRGLSHGLWLMGIRSALAEIHRVLKPGGWLSLCFAATHRNSWTELGQLLADAGFEPGGTAALEPAQKSFNRLKPTKVARQDLVTSWRRRGSESAI